MERYASGLPLWGSLRGYVIDGIFNTPEQLETDPNLHGWARLQTTWGLYLQGVDGDGINYWFGNR